MNNFDLIVRGFVDEIDDVSDTIPAKYEVWAIGYDYEGKATDAEFLLNTFDNPNSAVDFAESCTLADVVNMSAEDDGAASQGEDVAYILIEVETVINDGVEVNAGTIFRKTIDSTLADIELTPKDYFLTEEGNLKVSRELLKSFSLNDYIKIKFYGGNSLITYRIASETEDNHYICEFTF